MKKKTVLAACFLTTVMLLQEDLVYPQILKKIIDNGKEERAE